MLNKGKVPWCVQAGILVLLFLMSSADLIIEEKRIGVYPISVIIEEDNDDYYVDPKRGMDQAVVEFHGDVSFITLYVSDDRDQQTDLVKREIRDGTKVVILAPTKPEKAVRGLEDINPGRPVILLGQSPDKGGTLDTISVDGRKTGGLLGEAAASQVPRDAPVYLFCRGLDYGDSAQVYEGVRTVLGERGCHYRLIERKNRDTYCQATQGTNSLRGGRITIMALDVQSLDQAIRMLEENIICQGRVAGFCGAGSITSLLRAPDKGIVTGMTAYSQFDEGYLSVKQAVEAIQDAHQKQQATLKAVYVDEDKLRDKTYERMLYPTE